MKKLLVATSMAILSATAMAQNGNNLYAEIGYGFTDLEITEGTTYESTPGLGMLKLGYNINRNFAVEVMAGTSFSDDAFDNGADATGKIDSAYGIYVKGQFEAAKNLELFARLGYTNVDIKLDNGSAEKYDDGDFSYGVGMQYHFNKTVYGQIDYMVYYDDNGFEGADTKIDGFSLSIGMNF